MTQLNPSELAQKFISTSELCERYRLSRRTLLRWKKERGFPQEYMGGPGSENLHLMAEVLEWEEGQKKQRA